MRVGARPRSQWTTTQQLADSPRHDILWLWGTLTAGSLRTVSMHSMSWNAGECFPTVPVPRAAFPDIVLYCLFCDSARPEMDPEASRFRFVRPRVRAFSRRNVLQPICDRLLGFAAMLQDLPEVFAHFAAPCSITAVSSNAI